MTNLSPYHHPPGLAITLYTIFADILVQYEGQPLPPVTSLLGHMIVQIIK